MNDTPKTTQKRGKTSLLSHKTRRLALMASIAAASAMTALATDNGCFVESGGSGCSGYELYGTFSNLCGSGIQYDVYCPAGLNNMSPDCNGTSLTGISCS